MRFQKIYIKLLQIMTLILNFNSFCADLSNDYFVKTDLNGSVSQKNKNSSSRGFGYTFSFGYKFNNLVTGLLEAGYRVGHINFIMPFSDINLTETFHNYNLAVSNSSALADIYFYGEGASKYLVFNFTDCFKLQPFIGTGIGISINKAHKTRNCSWAAQALIGFELSYKYFAIGTGYRYFDGGRFKYNNYFVSRNINDDMFVLDNTIPLTGRFIAHEVFFYFNFSAEF